MNYTETYRKIYSSIKNDCLSHEEIHRFTTIITEAMAHLYTVTNNHDQKVLDTVSDIAAKLWNPLNLGGFDLDDKGSQPL